MQHHAMASIWLESNRLHDEHYKIERNRLAILFLVLS